MQITFPLFKVHNVYSIVNKFLNPNFSEVYINNFYMIIFSNILLADDVNIMGMKLRFYRTRFYIGHFFVRYRFSSNVHDRIDYDMDRGTWIIYPHWLNKGFISQFLIVYYSNMVKLISTTKDRIYLREQKHAFVQHGGRLSLCVYS